MENKVVLFSRGCPRCKVLEMKLAKKGIAYETVSDVDVMLERGFKEMPKLEVNGEVMDFTAAVKWVNEQE